MRIKVFEQVRNSHTFEPIGRRGNVFLVAINGWSYSVIRGINTIGVKVPGWTVAGTGRAYEFDCDYDDVFARVPLSDLSYRFRRMLLNLARQDGL